MTKRSKQTANEIENGPALTISVDKVCWIIIKAREFDVKNAPSESDPASNASDDMMIAVLEEQANDPVEQELRTFISSLSEDEQIDLVALVWLGRNDSTLADWPSIRAEAARSHRNHRMHTANYLLGDPLVSDFLEEALSLFGKSCDEGEIDKL